MKNLPTIREAVLVVLLGFFIGYTAKGLYADSVSVSPSSTYLEMRGEVDCFIGVPIIFGQGQLPGRGNLPEFEMVIIRVVPGTLVSNADSITIPQTPQAVVCTEHD